MIQPKDLVKGLRVKYDGKEAMVVKWDKQPDFTLPFLTMQPKKVTGLTHVLLNTNPHWFNSERLSDREIMTWGADSRKLDVDLDYYNSLAKT